MEINQIKKSVADFVKNLEGLVEKSLGDRSHFEEQVRGFAKSVEKSVSDMVGKRSFDKVDVKIHRLLHFIGELPKYETEHASGFDVRAAITEPIVVKPGARSLVATGLSFEIPPGYEIQVRARSGWAIKAGMGLVNAPGTIDADYRGEVKVIVINWGENEVTINPQDRIAQMVLCPVVQAEFYEGPLNETARGAGGFGSTGHS